MKIYDFSEIDKGMEMSPSTSKFIQEGMLERFGSLLKALTGSSTEIIVLHGCEWSHVGSNYTMTEGVLYYNDKIKFAPSFTGVSVAGTVPVWSTAVIQSDPKARFADGTFKFVFGSDNMNLEMDASGSGIADWDETVPFPSLFSLASISDLIPKANKAQEDWHYVGEAGEPAFENGWVNTTSQYALSFLKDEFGFVHIYGRISTGTIGSDVFTLPLDYRPAEVKMFICHSLAGSNRIEIALDGGVRASAYNGGSNVGLVIDLKFKV